MSVSIKQHYKSAGTQLEIELKRVMNAARVDIAAVQAEVVAIAAQLDADGGVTDTDYNTLTGGTLTLVE